MSLIHKIKGKTFLDLFWSFSDNLLQQIINFTVGIILARLLLPEEFGLLGIITVFLTLSTVFVDGGFSAALINKKEVADIHYNTVFYTNIAISCIIYLLIYFAANDIGLFFDNSRLPSLLRFSSINILLLSLSSIHRTILVRNLNFKAITIVSLVAVAISATVAIVMAYRGYGIYSLIYRVLLGEIVTIVMFSLITKWRPLLLFSKQSFRELFGYAINLFLANLLNTLNNNIYYIVIGKLFSASLLGYYTRAATFRDLASTNISTTIRRVSFSTLSKINDDQKQFKKFNFYRDVTFMVTSFSMIVLFFCSREIIIILLGDKWLPSIDILKIMSLTGVFMAVYNQNLDYLAVLGKTKRYLTIEIFGKLFIVPIVFIGIFYGLEMFLYSIVVQNVIMFLIGSLELESRKKGIFKKQLKLVLEFILILGFLVLIEKLLVINISSFYMSFFLKVSFVFIVWFLFNYKRLYFLVKE